jgi:hypothetical protein
MVTYPYRGQTDPPWDDQLKDYIDTSGGGGDASVFNVLRAPFSADPTGGADSTAGIQAALTAAAAFGYGATVYIPYGRYRFSDTLFWPIGVKILGGYGSGDGAGGFASNPPQLRWYGPASKNMVEAQNNGGSFGTTWYWMENLYLLCWAGYECKSGLVFPSRLDQGSRIRNVAIGGTVGQGASSGTVLDYCVEFRKGGINVHLQDFRFDAMMKHGIYWKIGTDAGSIDSLTLDKFTSDPKCEKYNKSGGTLHLDALTASSSHRLQLSVSRAKLETNLNLDVGEAHFRFDLNPAITDAPQILANFEHVWEAHGGSVTRYDGIRINPPNDLVDLQLHMSNLKVVNVPGYKNSRFTGVTHQHTDTMIAAPRSNDYGGIAASYRVARETVGDTNVMGQTFAHGKKASMILHTDMADVSLIGVDVLPGDILMDPATRSSGQRVMRECTQRGTLGTLTGVTGSLTANTATLTVNDATNLKVGNQVLIGGVDSRYIVSINRATSGTTATITLNSATIPNTYSNAAVTFRAPTFRDYTLVQQQAARANTSGATLANLETEVNELKARLRSAGVIAT